jgi:Fe-S-cluster containining protein
LHRFPLGACDGGGVMPSRFPVARRFELFDHTIAELTPRLRRMRSPHQLMAALRWGMDELDRTFAETPPGVRAQVACRSGCSACCQVPVDTQAHEVLFAADHIQTHFTPAAIEALIARLAAHRQRVAAFAPGERDHSRQPCALLRDDACSIYEGRPQPCRAHHTSDASACARHLADPSVEISAFYIPALRARMFAVMLGVDEAIEAAGYDERAYDFGSALHEALTNSSCLDAWLRHRSAFPDSCLADPTN